MGPADGPVKTAILGGNNARLYKVSPKLASEVLTDRLAQAKEIYDKHGGDRSNLYYGYIRKPIA